MNVRLALASLLSLLFAAAAAGAAAPALKAGVFEPPRQAPDFSLEGSDGSVLSMSRFKSKVVLLGFGFTYCPSVCPTTLATLAQARRKLGDAAADVQVVYVTVDPERDSAARMKEYLAAFDPTFVGGAGTAAQLAAVRKDYGVSAEKQGEGKNYQVAHSSFTYLIDRRGRLRALMPYGQGPDAYAHDLRILLNE